MKKIYAYGMISKSTLIRLESTFPTVNGYTEIAVTHVMVSSETANSANFKHSWDLNEAVAMCQ